MSAITFKVKGTFDPKTGDLKFMGKGKGKDMAAYDVKGMAKLEPKSKKGPYEIQYKKAGATKGMTTKGMLVTAPCVKKGANK